MKQFNEWDSETTTISDYVIEFAIPTDVYEYYKTSVFPSSGHSNINYGFSIYLKEEFETILKNRP